MSEKTLGFEKINFRSESILWDLTIYKRVLSNKKQINTSPVFSTEVISVAKTEDYKS